MRRSILRDISISAPTSFPPSSLLSTRYGNHSLSPLSRWHPRGSPRKEGGAPSSSCLVRLIRETRLDKRQEEEEEEEEEEEAYFEKRERERP